MKKLQTLVGALATLLLLTTTLKADQVEINWTSVTGAISYNVYERIAASGDPFVLAGNVTTNTFATDISTPGRREYYVKTVNLAGESTQSGSVFTPAAPVTPANYSVTTTGYTVALNWTASPGATLYNIYSQKVGSTNGYVVVASVTTNSYSTNMVESGQWGFYVKAHNLAGDSTETSTLFSASVLGPPGGVTITVTPSP